jgi:alkylation response protein AidB-like acyl-CoA dehydrogenase
LRPIYCQCRGKTSKFVAQQAVHSHGGIGMTEELAVGHYFRRLTAFGNLYGYRRHHVRRFAELGMAN